MNSQWLPYCANLRVIFHWYRFRMSSTFNSIISRLDALLGVLGSTSRFHLAMRTFGNTSGRTTLVQLSSHEFQTHSSSSCCDMLLRSTARPNDVRSLSRFGAFGKPSRRFYTRRSRHISNRPRSEGNFFGHAPKHGGNKTYLEIIGQSGSVLEYDAVRTTHDEFREAIPLYECETIVLRFCIAYGTYHAKSSAHTGTPQPNMSTIFMGKSSAEELECSEIPKSADPAPIAVSTH